MSSTHKQVCHAWANQTGKHTEGYAMFYDGPIIYSWGRHFPVARIVRPGLVLVTSKGYSVSTAKHKTYTRRAVPSSWHMLEVPNVLADSAEEHTLNYNTLIEETREALEKASRARRNGPWWMDEARRHINDANGYRTMFELDIPDVSLEGFGTAYEGMEQRLEAARAKADEERAARLRAQRRDQRAKLNPDLAAWLKGYGSTQHMSFQNHAFRMRPFVRVKGNKVETSWGADVPLDLAITAFRMAAKVRATGRPWAPKGLNSLMVGDFPLKAIGPTGNLIIGCHDIPYRHQQIAARLAGLELGEG